MKINKIVLFLVAISFSTLQAQKFEMGKVSVAELEEKEHPKDPSAAAAILFSKGNVEFNYNADRGFTTTTEVKTRIKIYKKEGYKWADFMVKYYLPSDSKETVYFDDVATYNLVEGKIVKTKIKSDGQFDEKINKYWGQKKITLPNIKEGSVIEYSYKIVSPNYGMLADWDFQTSIPVNYSEYNTAIPEYFTYRPNQKGYLFPKITTNEKQREIQYSYKEDMQPGLNAKSPERVNGSLKFKENTTKYVAEDLSAMRDEDFVNNISNYTSTISHELSIVRFPNSPSKNFSTDWASVTKTIYDNEDFGAELNKTGYFESDLNALLGSLTNQNEKLGAIFNLVKSTVKWDGFYGYSCNDGVRSAYKNKTGNVAEINLMLTAMLRYAGFSANPVLVSTRSNGISLFPNRTAYNYVVAAVEINDGIVLLDATERFSIPGVLPVRDLNWFGRLIRKDGTSTEIDMMPAMVSKENINMLYVVKANGEINGKVRKQVSDQLALSFRQGYVGVVENNYLENLENKNGKIEISDYKRENEMDLSKPIIETYAFKGTKGFDLIGDKIYLTPLLFLASAENPFKQEVREYPVDFSFPTQSKYNINIEIPEGYVVETLPVAAAVSTENNLGGFKYVIGTSGNKIQISIVEDINEAIVPSDYYKMLKDFFQKMVEKENEKIVLKKA